MTRLEAAALRAGERARQRAMARFAAILASDLPHLRVVISGDRVTITGRGVLGDPRLVWIGSLLR